MASTKKWPFHGIGDALDRYLQFFHRFQKRRLRFGRSAVDFVGKQYVGKNRSLDEDKLALSRGDIFLNDVGSGNVGRHQIRSELDPFETQVQNLRESFDQKRFCQARNSRNHGMSPDHQRNHHLVNHVILGNDDLSEFLQDIAMSCAEFFHQLRIINDGLLFHCVGSFQFR